MKISQIAVLVAAILAGALLIAGSNFCTSFRSLGGRPAGGPGAPPPARRMTIAVTPKTITDPYFVTCKEGADEAAPRTRREPALGRPRIRRSGEPE